MRQTPDGQLEFADKPQWITADILFKILQNSVASTFLL